MAFVVAKTLLGTGQATGVPHVQLLDRGQGSGVELAHPESEKTAGSPISEKVTTHLRMSNLLTKWRQMVLVTWAALIPPQRSL